MQTHHYFLQMARYNCWAYNKLFTGLANLTEKEYRQNQGLFFGGIHQTLNHLYVVDCIWYSRYTNSLAKFNNLRTEAFTERDELFSAINKQADFWISFVANLPAELPANLSYFNTKNIHYNMPYADTLLHVFNHATHHRGQISAIVTQLKFPAIEMDLVYFLREAEFDAETRFRACPESFV